MELRETITPTTNEYVLNLPDEMVGKRVEIIATEIHNPSDITPHFIQEEKVKKMQESLADMRKEKVSEIREIFDDMRIDLSNFKFDRDEANNYEE